MATGQPVGFTQKGTGKRCQAMEPHRRFDATVCLLQFLFVIVTGRFTRMCVRQNSLSETDPTKTERKETIVETNPAPQPAAEGKDWMTALMLSLFLGFLGVDRFYLG